jgi:uncharacterized protein YqhQ
MAAEPSHNQPMYGGQAVIEGVMMRGPQHFAVAARRANGEIALTCELVPKVLRPNWQKWPFLRGMFALVDSMTLGTKALFWAAKVAEADVVKPSTSTTPDAETAPSGPVTDTPILPADPPLLIPTSDTNSAPSGKSQVTDIAIGSAMVVGLLFAIGLFKVLPHFFIGVVKSAGVTNTFLLGLTDFAIRLTIFMTYILSIARMKHVYRVFQYHGAEHKAINALEAGGVTAITGPESVAAARAASRLHPRCGTSFVVIVIFLSVLAISPFYDLPWYARIAVQLMMLFPVAGISFELLRLAGKYRANPVADFFSRPGMWAQYLTTREPDDEQLEIAIASLNAVMAAEKPQAQTDTPVVVAAVA